MRLLAAVTVCLFTSPAAAWAAGATISSRDLPLRPVRTTAGLAAPSRFDLVGLHWQGQGRVSFRTRSVGGRWSAWQPAAPESEDRPDRGAPESRARQGWHLGNPYWVGPSDRIDYRLEGDVRRLRGYFVRSPAEKTSLRTISLTTSPSIIPRIGWQADEGIRRSPPRYAKGVYLAVVHHTAGSSTYRPETSAAIVRGIELYHVRGNGWNDIGYNFLVDRYGQIFEGRYGGADRNVIGAHAEGFNTGSVGVAVIGNYSSTPITPAAQHSLAELLAWRLDVAHVDPLGVVPWISGGNAKYARGTHVSVRAISGHRDTGFTSCPGDALYARVPDLAREAAGIGLPKLYAPTVRGGLGGLVRFSARLSSAGTWAVTVKNAAGKEIARGSGNGVTVDWTWSSVGVAPGRYVWTIEGGPDTRPAQGTLGRAPAPPPPVAPLVSGLTLDPPVISPDGDGIADVTTISYTLAARASVTVTVRDTVGMVVATLFSGQLQGARRQSFPYAAQGLPDGSYVVSVSAVGEDARTGRVEAPLAIDRTLSALSLTTQVLTPNGDGSDDTVGIGFALAVAADVTVQIEQGGVVVATVFAGSLPAGTSQLSWDGTTPSGTAPDGAYQVAVLVKGPFGTTRHAVALTIARQSTL